MEINQNIYFEIPAKLCLSDGGHIEIHSDNSGPVKISLRLELEGIKTEEDQSDVLKITSFFTDEAGSEYSCVEYVSARELFLKAAQGYLSAKDVIFDPHDPLTGEKVFSVELESEIVKDLSYFCDDRDHFPLMAWKRVDEVEHKRALLFYRFREKYASATIDIVEMIRMRSGKRLSPRTQLRISFLSDFESVVAIDSSETQVKMDRVGLYSSSPFYADFFWSSFLWQNSMVVSNKIDGCEETRIGIKTHPGAFWEIKPTGKFGSKTRGVRFSE